MSERLNRAAQEGNLELVLQVLESGNDPEEEDENEVTALMLAAEQGHLEVMKALLALGAYADAADANGVTVLMRAALKGHVEAVRLLLEEFAFEKGHLLKRSTVRARPHCTMRLSEAIRRLASIHDSQNDGSQNIRSSI